jgi:tetratricopeptide (TPR) repeat protein
LPNLQHFVHTLRGLFVQAGEGFSALKDKSQWALGDHSALVRKLLREFREGDSTRALRQAFSMVPADPRQPSVGWGNRLPWSRAVYSLLELLGQPARGESIAVWRAKPDLMRELATEYRKAAERAGRQGDFRRAAYIYGKLLGDDRMAAHALQRGGLYRDAAILYLKKLNDLAAAAQAFEAAGEVDRAIALYRQLGQHETAGDLLRRIGEEDGALAEYLRAAELRTAAVPPDYQRAGLILLHKARRLDLAIESFHMGWDRRPADNAMPCARELARLHAEQGAIGPMRKLLDEGDSFFGSSGSDSDAAGFYNMMALLAADTPALRPFAEEVRDRALLALARRLRQSVERGRRARPVVSTLLSEATLWPPAVVTDAEFAATAAKQSRGPGSATSRDPRVQGVQIGHGTVTAVCQGSVSGELFIGFDSGLVLGFKPGRSQIVRVWQGTRPVTALTVAPDGQMVVALHETDRGTSMSCSVKGPDGSFRTRPEDEIPALSRSWLTPILPWGCESLVGLGDGQDLLIVYAFSGLHWGRLTLTGSPEDPPTAAILLPVGSKLGTPEGRFVVLTHDGWRWIIVDPQGEPLRSTGYSWRPAVPVSSSLRCVPLAWRQVPPFLEMVGLDKNGAVYAAQFFVEDSVLELVGAQMATTEGGYLAATRCGTSMVVAMAATHIDWLSISGDRFHVFHKLHLALPTAVACFRSSSPHEILAVCSDGFVARIGAPQRLSKAARDA